MGKDTKRGNREVRKPKKAKEPQAAATLVGLNISSSLASPKKKKR
jgi:hypothetical protein